MFLDAFAFVCTVMAVDGAQNTPKKFMEVTLLFER
jgi:hypothetical protein